MWSLIGGGIEPEEEPAEALVREVEEELGVTPGVGRIIGAYGGVDLSSTYPNGDRVSYVTIAYECTIPNGAMQLEAAELLEVGWFELPAIATLDRHRWIDRVLDDCE